jgi:hypothetical protein
MSIIGNIDHISKYKISGWARNTDDKEPLIVEILVNDVLLKKIRADLYRKDLEKVKCNGECAFELSISGQLLDILPFESNIKIKCNSDYLSYGVGVKNIINGGCNNDSLFIEKLKEGHIVNKNGIILRPIKERGDQWIVKALEDYQLLKTVFKIEFGYDLCIAYGTLLGFIRENAPIGHDDDLDAFYISKYKQSSDVAKELHEIVRVFEKYGHQARALNNGQIHVAVKDGIVVDIFTAWFSNASFHLYFSVKTSSINAEDIFPIQEVDFLSSKVCIPNKPKRMLENIYGDKWMTPDPYFQWRINTETKSYFTEYDRINVASSEKFLGGFFRYR